MYIDVKASNKCKDCEYLFELKSIQVNRNRTWKGHFLTANICLKKTWCDYLPIIQLARKGMEERALDEKREK